MENVDKVNLENDDTTLEFHMEIQYVGYWVPVRYCCSIEGKIITTHSPFTILLFWYHVKGDTHALSEGLAIPCSTIVANSCFAASSHTGGISLGFAKQGGPVVIMLCHTPGSFTVVLVVVVSNAGYC